MSLQLIYVQSRGEADQPKVNSGRGGGVEEGGGEGGEGRAEVLVGGRGGNMFQFGDRIGRRGDGRKHSVRRGVSKGEEDGRRMTALQVGHP
jgi:hypothetical protein